MRRVVYAMRRFFAVGSMGGSLVAATLWAIFVKDVIVPLFPLDKCVGMGYNHICSAVVAELAYAHV